MKKKSAFYDLKSQISRLWSYSLILCFLHLKNISLPTPLSELHFCVWSIDKAIFRWSLLVLLCSVQLTRKKRLNPLVLSFLTKILTEILDEHWETKCQFDTIYILIKRVSSYTNKRWLAPYLCCSINLQNLGFWGKIFQESNKSRN